MVADVATFQNDTPKLLTKLAGHLVGDLRRYLTEHRSRIERTLLENRPGFDAARAYARLYDGVLSALFGACHAAMLQRGQWVPLSLGAVGSYGRRVLSPFSDLDVRAERAELASRGSSQEGSRGAGQAAAAAAALSRSERLTEALAE